MMIDDPSPIHEFLEDIAQQSRPLLVWLLKEFLAFDTQILRFQSSWDAQILSRLKETTWHEALSTGVITVAQFLDALRDFVAANLVGVKGYPKTFASFCLYLPQYVANSDDGAPSALKSSAITESYAYLALPEGTQNHIYDVYLASRGESPIAPWIINNQLYPIRCVYPAPTEECLLYLALTGSKSTQPFAGGLTVRKAFVSIGGIPSSSLQCSTKEARDGIELEAVVSVGLCVSSHLDGVAGTKFPRFLYWTILQLRSDTGVIHPLVPDLPTPTSFISQWADIDVPFLCIPNQRWPSSLTRITGTKFGLLQRLPDSAGIDFSIFQVGQDNPIITGEAKNYEEDTMKKEGAEVISGIIDRAAKHKSTIHLVFATNLHCFSPNANTKNKIANKAAGGEILQIKNTSVTMPSVRLLMATIDTSCGNLVLESFKGIEQTNPACDRCMIFIDPEQEMKLRT
jgi:uncharacterized membrane protein YhdT